MIFDGDQKEYLDATYVCKDYCDKRLHEIDVRENALDKSVSVLNAKLTWLLGILGAIGVAVLGIAVKLLFGG